MCDCAKYGGYPPCMQCVPDKKNSNLYDIAFEILEKLEVPITRSNHANIIEILEKI